MNKQLVSSKPPSTLKNVKDILPNELIYNVLTFINRENNTQTINELLNELKRICLYNEENPIIYYDEDYENINDILDQIKSVSIITPLTQKYQQGIGNLNVNLSNVRFKPVKFDLTLLLNVNHYEGINKMMELGSMPDIKFLYRLTSDAIREYKDDDFQDVMGENLYINYLNDDIQKYIIKERTKLFNDIFTNKKYYNMFNGVDIVNNVIKNLVHSQENRNISFVNPKVLQKILNYNGSMYFLGKPISNIIDTAIINILDKVLIQPTFINKKQIVDRSQSSETVKESSETVQESSETVQESSETVQEFDDPAYINKNNVNKLKSLIMKSTSNMTETYIIKFQKQIFGVTKESTNYTYKDTGINIDKPFTIKDLLIQSVKFYSDKNNFKQKIEDCVFRNIKIHGRLIKVHLYGTISETDEFITNLEQYNSQNENYIKLEEPRLLQYVPKETSQ